MVKLTHMQQKVYDYIVSCIQSQGYPPSVREIGDAVGLKSPSTVHFHLKHLEEAGVIAKGAGKGRAIALTEPPVSKNQVPILGNVAAGSPIWQRSASRTISPSTPAAGRESTLLCGSGANPC